MKYNSFYLVPRKKSKFGFIKLFIKLSFILGIFGVVAIGGVFAYYSKDLPSPASMQELKIAQSTKIYDRTGKVLLYDIHGEYKRTIIPFEDIPDYLKLATIVAEDAGFYNHFGVDFRGIARAALANIRGKAVLQGGSTITQQLIKNIFLTPERTLARKAKEIILTLEMELKYSKEQILDFYINAVPYGSNAYGAEAAAQTFFAKRAKDLTLAESALLAALPKAPTYYSPYGANTDELKRRQNYILGRMRNFDYISDAELKTAQGEELTYVNDSAGIKAPHFVMYVREQLEKDFGDAQLKSAGLNVVTTLDWELQQEAERIVKEWAAKNEKKFKAKNAALVALDPSNGHILAMVGSRDYFNKEIDGNVNVALRLRQPGSSFKPFAYAQAFLKGYTPDTIVIDAETNFGVQGAKEYIPGNYDGKFRGHITLKAALAQSINIPAVKVLYLAGLADTIQLARSMGVLSLKQDPSHYGLSLVLGGGGVTLLEETSAYGVFAKGGIYNKPTALLSIQDTNGDYVYKFEPSSKEVLDPKIARLITSILSDNELRAPMFGEQSALYIPDIPAAVKTGTAQEYRDAWTIGYTPKIVVGVWGGNNDNSPMYDGDGSKVAAPIWRDFMQKTYILKQWQAEDFTLPDTIETGKPILDGSLGNPITIPVDAISGKIATQYTPKELIEEKTFYEFHSLLYYIQKDNPQGEPPQNPENDPQFILWEEGVKRWLETQTTSSVVYGIPPTQHDDIHIPENFPKLSILSPQQNRVLSGSKYLELTLEIYGNFPVQKIELIFDDRARTSITNLSVQNRIYSTLIELPLFFMEEKGPHMITVRAIDSVLNNDEERLIIEIAP